VKAIASADSAPTEEETAAVGDAFDVMMEEADGGGDSMANFFEHMLGAARE